MQDDQTKDDNVEEVVADEPQEKQEPNLAEPEAKEEKVEPAEEVSQEESEEEAPEEKPPSRREQLRIQSLLQKYGDPRQPQQAPSQRGLDYGQALDADPEVIRQLEADRQAASNMSYNEGLRRAEFLDWRTSLKIESPGIEKKYPILDKNSTEFHPAVADALNTMYLKMSGFDPGDKMRGIPPTVGNADISYVDFVESNMELVEEIASQKNLQTTKNIAQQAATTGLRPDGSSAKRLNLNRDPKDMTMEELYASIGQPMPTK